MGDLPLVETAGPGLFLVATVHGVMAHATQQEPREQPMKGSPGARGPSCRT